MSDTKSNPYTLIAGFLLPWKITKNSTRKEQPNNNKKPCAWILPLLQCLQNPTRFITLPGKILAKSHKFKKSKTFRLFEFFDFFDFSTFRLFEFFDFSSRNLLECELFDFSTFRLFAVKKSDFHGVTATSQKSTQDPGTQRLALAQQPREVGVAPGPIHGPRAEGQDPAEASASYSP